MALLMPKYFQRENSSLKANWYRLKTSFTGIKRFGDLAARGQGCLR